MVCRLGGDEFVVLLDTTSDSEAPLHLANSILRAMEPPFHLDGSLVFVSTSIGIAHSTATARSASVMPARAAPTSTPAQAGSNRAPRKAYTVAKS